MDVSFIIKVKELEEQISSLENQFSIYKKAQKAIFQNKKTEENSKQEKDDILYRMYCREHSCESAIIEKVLITN